MGSTYDNVRIPETWHLLIVRAMQGFAAKCNWGFKRFPDEPWYAFSGDDGIGRTSGWDTALAAEAMKGQVAWGNDLNGGNCTQPFIYGDYVRDVGWLCHPKFKHLYVDEIWYRVATRAGVACYRSDIIQENLHFSNGKVPRDQTSMERMERDDPRAYMDLLANNGLDPLVGKVMLRHESLCR